MSTTNTPFEDQVDEILNKFGGLLLGNWKPLPGEEGMVYPTRLQKEAKAALTQLHEAAVREAESITADIEFKAGINHSTQSIEAEILKAKRAGIDSIIGAANQVTIGDYSYHFISAEKVAERIAALQKDTK